MLVSVIKVKPYVNEMINICIPAKKLGDVDRVIST